MRGRDRPLRYTTFQKSMDLDRALAFSRYAKSALGCDPELKAGIEATLAAPLDWAGPFASLDAAVADGDPAKLAANLRALRRHVFVHVLLRDLTGRAPLSEVMQAMTLLADRSLQAAVDVHGRALAAAHGAPIGAETGAPQRLVVIAMGKLGGGELNVSS